jgi:hypothetical protein
MPLRPSSTKTAVDFDKSAERPTREKPTHREPVQVNVVPAHGVTNPDLTPDQTTRSHSEAKDPAAKAQGAIVPGEDGLDNAKRRSAAIIKRRKETEAVFAANRKATSIVRKK